MDLVAKALAGSVLAGSLALALLIWNGGAVPAWSAALAIIAVVAIAVALGVRAGRRHGIDYDEVESEAAAMAWAVERYEIYTEHVADVLDRLQRVLTGDLEGVAIPDYIQRGILAPARDVLQEPHDDIRISVLLAAGDRWRMVWAAGHSLDGQQAYNERIVDTLSREPYESGEREYWPDATKDDRFRPNPEAVRPFHSMLCEPIRSGSTVVGVLNVLSSSIDAFDPAEQSYIASLASVIGVAVSVHLGQED